MEPDPHGAIVTAGIDVALEAGDPLGSVLLDPGGDCLPQDAKPPGGAAALAVDDPDLLCAMCVIFDQKITRGVQGRAYPHSVQIERRDGPRDPGKQWK